MRFVRLVTPTVEVMGAWQPRDEVESDAGWRLWLALSTRVWPDESWDGTPAAAVAGLHEIAWECAALRSTCPGDTPVLRLVDSVVFVVSLPLDLWRDDRVPVDADRAALLHSDLAGVAGHFADLRAVLAEGGGWAELV